MGRTLDSAASHAQPADLFEERRLYEPEAELRWPKWKGLKLTLHLAQQEAGNGNPVLGFLTFILRPSRFVENPARSTETCERVNRVLAFYGLRFREDGKFVKILAAATIDEARERAGRLRAESRDFASSTHGARQPARDFPATEAKTSMGRLRVGHDRCEEHHGRENYNQTKVNHAKASVRTRRAGENWQFLQGFVLAAEVIAERRISSVRNS